MDDIVSHAGEPNHIKLPLQDMLLQDCITEKLIGKFRAVENSPEVSVESEKSGTSNSEQSPLD